jgi:hypothetical protein
MTRRLSNLSTSFAQLNGTVLLILVVSIFSIFLIGRWVYISNYRPEDAEISSEGVQVSFLDNKENRSRVILNISI